MILVLEGLAADSMSRVGWWQGWLGLAACVALKQKGGVTYQRATPGPCDTDVSC